jgi:hypothetical protein
MFQRVMSWDPCVLVEHINVNFRFLCTILKEDAEDVFVWPTEICHICQTHQQGHYQYMQTHQH